MHVKGKVLIVEALHMLEQTLLAKEKYGQEIPKNFQLRIWLSGLRTRCGVND